MALDDNTVIAMLSKYGKVLRRITQKKSPEEKEMEAYLTSDTINTEGFVGTVHAMLAGDNNIVTFDKTHFEFEGPCRYPLARYKEDAKGNSPGDFILSAVYSEVEVDGVKEIVRTAITIENENGKEVTIRQSAATKKYEVLIDDKAAELPIALVNPQMQITRKGGSIQARLVKGAFIMTCSQFEVCVFDASKHLHGKLWGLLGDMNSEPADDATTANGDSPSNTTDLVASWNVDLDEECARKVTPVSKTPENLEVSFAPEDNSTELCNTAFGASSSGLKLCFNTIDPQIFLQICLRDLARLPNKTPFEVQKSSCRIIAMYFEDCKRQHVKSVSMPTECARCETPIAAASNGEGPKVVSVKVGERILIRNESFDMARVKMAAWDAAPKESFSIDTWAADVVFVIEEDAPCMLQRRQEGIHSSFSDMLRKVDIGLGAGGASSIRYAIVGFGSHVVRSSHRDQHVHTLPNGNEFGSMGEVEKMLVALQNFHDTLQVGRLASSKQVATTYSHSTTIYNALNLAAALNFRPGSLFFSYIYFLSAISCFEIISLYKLLTYKSVILESCLHPDTL